jgi:hypothetical protein
MEGSATNSPAAQACSSGQPEKFARITDSLLQSGEFLRRVLASSGDCIKVLDLDARLQFMSSGGMVVMEIENFEPFVGCPWLDFWIGEFEPQARAAVEEARAGRTGRFQGFCKTAKGTPKWWDVQVVPLLGADGRPEQLLSVSTDITERKRADDRQRVLMQELEHRVKNTLALVQSISNQTFRDAASLDDARQTLTQRLLVLGKAHDLLTQTSWTSASIGTVIASATAPYVEPGRQRFSVAGPELSLAPKPALALTMALHELCTNAAKYGALSNGAGQVSIGWDVQRASTAGACTSPGPSVAALR